MAWTKYQIFLAAVLVVSGSINTIAAKWADRQEAIGTDGEPRHFNHPFTQATFMFFGEMLNLWVYYIFYFVYWKKSPEEEDFAEKVIILKGNRRFNPLLLWPPAMFDMLATCLMYTGLNLTYASSYQMLRGAVIIFTGILSRIFLHRILEVFRIIGIVLVVVGLALVGLADFLPTTKAADDSDGSSTAAPDIDTQHSSENIIIGDLLIVIAQLLAAMQFVWEEKFLAKHDIPALLAVGWEGVFGIVVLSLLHIPFYFIFVPKPFGANSRGVMEDALDAFHKMGDNYLILIGLTGTAVSVAFFNFSGVSVTKELSATTRKVVDSLRTIVIWVFSLAFRWQSFQYLQLIGFLVLLSGMFVYNDILLRPLFFKIRDRCSGKTETPAEGTEEAKPTTSK